MVKQAGDTHHPGVDNTPSGKKGIVALIDSNEQSNI